MLKHYNKVAIRNLAKHKFFSAINVIGLSIAISVCLLIGIHVVDELSYETSYPKHEHIYRLATRSWAKSSPLLATEFKKEMPEVVEVGRLFTFEPTTVEYNERQVLIEHPYIGDPSILEIFDIEFIEGSSNALNDPSSVVITESMAKRLFRNGERRIGEVIDFDDGWFLTVKGVIKDFPVNSHLKIDCISSSKNSRIMRDTDRLWAGVSIYTLFNSKEDVEKVRKKLLDFKIEFLNGIMTREEILAENELLELIPIEDIHLHSHREKEISVNSDIKLIYIFSSLGAFILLVAIINFINLQMAQSLNRVKEIVVRKIIGSTRKQLIFQFLIEVIFLIVISVLLALIITSLSLPYYNQLANIPVTLGKLFSSSLLTLAFVVPMFVGGLASLLTSYYLSKLNLSDASGIKDLKIGYRFPVRRIMVSIQFMISTFLLITTFIVSKQIDFIKSKNMGFASDEVIAIKLHGGLKIQAILSSSTIKAELEKLSEVSHVSFCSHLIGNRISIEPFYLKSSPESVISPRIISAEPEFLETMGISVLKGGIERREFKGNKYFINESAALLFQKSDLLARVGVNPFRQKEGLIVGTIKDFHFASLHHKIDPLVIQLSNEDLNALNYLVVRFQSFQPSITVEKIEQTLKEMAPGALVTSLLVSEYMSDAYQTESDMFVILKVFSTIGIGLALVGMLALFAFITKLRTKEMGIRKTMGASMLQMVLTLSKSYILMLIIVGLLAIPFVNAFAVTWLEDFAYRVPIKWWFFILPATAIFVIAVSTISIQALRIAHINPVKSLKNE